MKKITLLTVLFTIGFMNAQKNTLLVGGHIGYSSSKSEYLDFESKSNRFNFSPVVGYQLHDNWTVGINSNISSSTSENFSEETTKAKSLSIGPFVRYTKTISETFAVYGDLGTRFQKSKTTLQDDSSEDQGYYIGFVPAILINIKNGFALNFNIGGISYIAMSNNDLDIKTSGFGFNFGSAFSIGVSKNFTL